MPYGKKQRQDELIEQLTRAEFAIGRKDASTAGHGAGSAEAGGGEPATQGRRAATGGENPVLDDLCESFRSYNWTEEDKRDFAVSFAYGNLKIDRPDVSREQVEKMYDDMYSATLHAAYEVEMRRLDSLDESAFTTSPTGLNLQRESVGSTDAVRPYTGAEFIADYCKAIENAYSKGLQAALLSKSVGPADARDVKYGPDGLPAIKFINGEWRRE